MALAVELYFDERTEERILALRRIVHLDGARVAPDLEAGRPHISFALVETSDAELLASVVAGVARRAPLCQVELAAPASFATRAGLLYLAPVPTMALLEFHSRFHAGLVAAGLESNEYYRPGAWIPHCTLAMDLSEAQLAAAFVACRKSMTPITGHLEAAGVVSFPPPRPHFVVPLGATARARSGSSKST